MLAVDLNSKQNICKTYDFFIPKKFWFFLYPHCNFPRKMLFYFSSCMLTGIHILNV